MMHPKAEGHTWFSSDGTKASRIDYVFTRECPPSDARISPVFFSDHAMLSCTLTLPPGVTVGKGLWKLNCSLLQDKEVTKEYREQYREWQTLQDFFDSRAQWWEMVMVPADPGQGYILFSVGIQMGEAEEGGDEEDAYEWRERSTRLIFISWSPFYCTAHEIRHINIK